MSVLNFFPRVFSFLYNVLWPVKISLTHGRRILIAKVNQLGDVTMSLPLASALKRAEPTCTIIFLGRGYTKELIEAYADVDEFADWDALRAGGLGPLRADILLNITDDRKVYAAGYAAGIPVRVGSLRKPGTWLTCTHWVNIDRNGSGLHETQLDMQFLKPLDGVQWQYSLPEIMALRRFRVIPAPSPALASLLDPTRFNLILHPKTRGQHQEWPVERFQELIAGLPRDRFNIFITGSAQERCADAVWPPGVHDLVGRTTLADLLHLIAAADGLIAASTGPVHLAANFGKWTLGLYTQKKPQYAVRWGPVGPKAQVLTAPSMCDYCQRDFKTACWCLESISAAEVAGIVFSWVGCV